MWILQKNIWKEEKYNLFCGYLGKYGIDHKIIDLIPFTEKLDLPTEVGNIEMIFGSIRFTELLRNEGCKSFFNDNFNYLVWSEIFKDSCLNYPATVSKIGDLSFPLNYDIFIRPVLDDKSFTGTIMREGDDLSVIQFGTTKPIKDIEVSISPIKKIYSETRYFVVGEDTVTS